MRSSTVVSKAIDSAAKFAGKSDEGWNLRFREALAREGLTLVEIAMRAPQAIRGAPGAWPAGALIVDAQQHDER